jgi:hypothetical protein
MTKENVKILWTTTSRQMEEAKIPFARSLLGFYPSLHMRAGERKRLQLVDLFTANDAALVVHGSEKQIDK